MGELGRVGERGVSGAATSGKTPGGEISFLSSHCRGRAFFLAFLL